MSNAHMYSIPKRFRKIENFHIILWLIKDMSWAMVWKPLGLFMILPTVSVALLITWQTRMQKAELYHNLAVDFWIFANCYWMITEFMNRDDLRHYTIVPFSIGIVFIAIYYILVLPGERKAAKL